MFLKHLRSSELLINSKFSTCLRRLSTWYLYCFRVPRKYLAFFSKLLMLSSMELSLSSSEEIFSNFRCNRSISPTGSAPPRLLSYRPPPGLEPRGPARRIRATRRRRCRRLATPARRRQPPDPGRRPGLFPGIAGLCSDPAAGRRGVRHRTCFLGSPADRPVRARASQEHPAWPPRPAPPPPSSAGRRP